MKSCRQKSEANSFASVIQYQHRNVCTVQYLNGANGKRLVEESSTIQVISRKVEKVLLSIIIVDDDKSIKTQQLSRVRYSSS